MGHTIEFDFISDEGLRCVGLALTHGHRCGYAAVPEGHVLYGVRYGDTLPDAVAFVTEELLQGADISHRGVMPMFIAALSGNINRLDVVIDVHGSLTFSKPSDEHNYPAPSTEKVWWFGFDCGHSGDGKDFSIMDDSTREMYESRPFLFSEGPIRSAEYVKQHCRLLARQLWYIGQMVAQSALPAGTKV
jgi:hypothetical protein